MSGAARSPASRTATAATVDACWSSATPQRTARAWWAHPREPRPTPPEGSEVLTPRETEIVKLIAEAHSSKEIAELLVISPKTVERHRANILQNSA